jgi:protein-S-isoprenylcysteine O-methyltransferase Ste14
MEIRTQIFSLLPALGLALYQVLIVWASLPKYSEDQTERNGEYTADDQISLYSLQRFCYILFSLQLFFTILPLTSNTALLIIISIIGYAFILFGFLMSLNALETLGSNWTGMAGYRIKKGQTLVTEGVYKYIRHPIYAAIIYEVVGYEMIANSLLSVILGVLAYYYLSQHIRKEEKLMESEWGEKYISYKKSCGRFMPKNARDFIPLVKLLWESRSLTWSTHRHA